MSVIKNLSDNSRNGSITQKIDEMDAETQYRVYEEIKGIDKELVESVSDTDLKGVQDDIKSRLQSETKEFMLGEFKDEITEVEGVGEKSARKIARKSMKRRRNTKECCFSWYALYQFGSVFRPKNVNQDAYYNVENYVERMAKAEKISNSEIVDVDLSGLYGGYRGSEYDEFSSYDGQIKDSSEYDSFVPRSTIEIEDVDIDRNVEKVVDREQINTIKKIHRINCIKSSTDEYFEKDGNLYLVNDTGDRLARIDLPDEY